MEMTLTRALAEVKMLENRISKAIATQTFIAVSRGVGDKRAIVGAGQISDTEATIKSSYQATLDLIKRRNDIKSKIVAANAEHKFTLGGREYTIAEAIDRKYAITFERQLLDRAKQAAAAARVAHDQLQNKLLAEIDQQYNQILAKDTTRRSDTDLFNMISDRLMQERQPGFVDPLKLEKVVADLEDSIDEFTNNVDFALSEINAQVKIEV